ncbi:glycosyltransferase [Nitratifractor sp.]
MNQPRVLHTEWSDGWGGQEIRILSEMLAVRERGVEVYLACQERARIAERAKQEGIQVFTLPFRGNADLSTLWKLIRIIKRYDIDIVNTHSGKDTWVGGLAAKLAGARFIRTRHLSNPINPSRLNFINSLADFVITTGESVREEMIRNNRIDPRKIMSIPTGIDEKRFHPDCCTKEEARGAFQLPHDRIIIGNLAVLRSFKRHDLFIESAKVIHQEYPDTFFAIAGDGPQRPRLEELITNYRLEDCVRLIGHTDEPELFLKALDLFVLSSDSKEGVPQSVIQALMMGLPVIATDVGSTRDLYDGENMLLIEAGKAETIVEAVETLLNNPERMNLLKNKSTGSINSFTRKSMTSKLLSLYSQLLDPNKT